MTFSDSQQKAIDKFTEWYKDPTKLIFTLYGAAGTGKTFVTRHLLNSVIEQSSCVSAPTHKAVRVIEHMTGRKGKTLQSLHGLRPNFNLEKFNIDNVKFDSLGNIYFKNYKIVLIDECSQIGNDLQHLNELRAKQYNTKILYIGDAYQLPPVGEKLSKTFEIEDKFELTDIIRQEDTNPLLRIFKLIRSDIKNNTSTFIEYLQKHPKDINDKGEGYIIVNKDEFKELLKIYFDNKKFYNNVTYCRYAAWTNNSINSWNSYIRSLLIDSDQILSKDDLLTGYKTIVDEYLSPILINSEDYIVKSITDRTSESNFKTYITTLQAIVSSEASFINVIDHKDAEAFLRFYRQLDFLHRNAMYAKPADRGRIWREYFEFKDRHLVLTTFPIKDDRYKDGVRAWVTKDIDYGYGLTVHKLQGSTLENIFVNLLDICYIGNRPIVNTDGVQLRNKLIYTALSRASKLAIILF